MVEIIKINIDKKEDGYNIKSSITDFINKYKINQTLTFELKFYSENKDITELWKEKKTFTLIQETIEKIMREIKIASNNFKKSLEELEEKYNKFLIF